MPVNVSSTEKAPTHHVSLTDKDGKTLGLITYSRGEPDPVASGRSPVDRTAMKTTTGNQKYSDFEPPYAPIVQEDWSGGRGSAEFERNTTMYADANRVNTRRANRVFLAGQVNYATGIQAGDQAVPGNVSWMALIDSNRYQCRMITTTSAYTGGRIWLLVRRVGTPNGVFSARLRADNATAPGTVLDTVTLAVATVTDITSEWRILSLGTPQSLGSGTNYWVECFGASGDTSTDHWEVAMRSAVGATKSSADGTTYALGTKDLYYRLNPALSTTNGWFFEYKGSVYFVTKPASGAPVLNINGDRGAADANTGALGTLVDATKAWTVDEWVGCVVQIIAGTGKSETVVWRTITANNGTTLTVDTPWTITHDTTTEYIILGSLKWTEITGHGMTAPVTGHPLISSKGVVYFPQGDTVAMVRMREYNNSGTWTREFAADGTNKAKLLTELGGTIWKANDDDSGAGTGDASADSATAQLWGTSLTFSGTEVVCGSNLRRITNLIPYVDSDSAMAPWVLKEEILGFIKSGVFYPLLLDEMNTVRSPKNGQAAITLNSYLYFSLMNGWESYYRPTLDDIGPNTGEGLPQLRQGAIVDAVGYPGRMFAAINAGTSGYSSILCYDNQGWHEEYRAPLGEQIQAMMFQPVPGATPDRLWFACGADLAYIPFPSETTNPLNDSSFPFCHEGSLELSYMYAGMQDAMKFCKGVRVVTENLDTGNVEIVLDYRVDGETEWTEIGTFDTSPVQELDFSDQFGLAGKELQFRLRFYTNDATKTPLLKVFIADTVTRVPNKFAYSLPFVISDDQFDLTGIQDDTPSAVEKIRQLDRWAEETMLYLNSVNPLLDGKLVFILPIDSRPLTASLIDGKWQYQGTLVAQDA